MMARLPVGGQSRGRASLSSFRRRTSAVRKRTIITQLNQCKHGPSPAAHDPGNPYVSSSRPRENKLHSMASQGAGDEEKKQGGFSGAFKNLGFASRLTGTGTPAGAMNVRTSSPVREDSSRRRPDWSTRSHTHAHYASVLVLIHTAD